MYPNKSKADAVIEHISDSQGQQTNKYKLQDATNVYAFNNIVGSGSTGVSITNAAGFKEINFHDTNGNMTVSTYNTTNRTVDTFTVPKQATAQSDSTATDITTLKNDFNALLAKLRVSKVIG